MKNEYKLSNNRGNIFIVGLLLGSLFTLISTIIYNAIELVSPIFFLTLILYAGYLFSIVFIQKIVIRISKCRSKESALLYGSIVGLFAVYINWASFINMLLNKQGYDVSFFQSPSDLFNYMVDLSKVGYFSVFGMKVSGFLLWIIWIIESAGIFLAGIFGGETVLHEEVFCENCNTWTDEIELKQYLSVPNEASKAAILNGDIQLLLRQPLSNSNDSKHLKLNIHHCSKCNKTSTLDIDLVTSEIDDKGIEERVQFAVDKIYVKLKAQIDDTGKDYN
jgi:hypothetical protein